MNRKQRDTQEPRITTVEGDPDLSSVQPGDQVIAHSTQTTKGGFERERQLFVPANMILTEGRKPITEAEEGSTPMLGGENFAVRLGNDILVLTGVQHPEASQPNPPQPPTPENS